jgi:hypothetical protein
MTGGSLMGMTKTLGVFSKSARQINEPQLSTIMVKGNRMRSEHSNGQVEIIDLDGRRFINIDPAKKTYSTMTFEEFKAAMQRAQERAKEEQAKAQAKATKSPEASNVTIVPKFTAEETGATKTVLDLPTKEVKWRLAMEFQSTDPKVQQQGQSGAMTMNSDAWIASTVPGYDELRQFYVHMSKELDWLPSTMGGMTGMNMQMGSASTEFQKQMIQAKGMPLMQNVSFGMTATGVPQNQNGQAQASSQNTPPPAQDKTDSTPTNPKDAIAKSIGGMFGGFGKKKKQQDQVSSDQSTSTSTSTNASGQQTTTTSSSLMEMQIEVLSYSTNPLEKNLFDIPAGYTQVQADPDAPFGAGRR